MWRGRLSRSHRYRPSTKDDPVVVPKAGLGILRDDDYSVFDGLELVVTNMEGKTLAQQHYDFHQSPFSPRAKEAILKKGTTAGRMVFPIRIVPGDPKVVKIRLVGTLPGAEYRGILSTETIEVEIKE